MYAITGASGQLGRLVVAELLKSVDPSQIVALVRDPAKVADLGGVGVQVRQFDYSAPAGLAPALVGVQRLLLISSSEVGQREVQHRAVIDAAVNSGVSYVAYTSILRAADNPLALAVEHRATEALLGKCGLPYTLLRNGWYNENYTVGIEAAIGYGAVLGSSGEGRVSSASRGDYAAAAAAVLLSDSKETTILELAGDGSFTQAEFAEMLTSASGKPVSYQDMPEAAYQSALESIGLPGPLAQILADSSAKAGAGALYDDGQALSRLIGRPTTTMQQTIAQALAG